MNTGTENAAATPPIAPPMPARAIVVLVCGLLATWLAAGSLGWIAPPLQKSLTWLALGTVFLMALPAQGATARAGLISGFIADGGLVLSGAAIIAILLTAFDQAVANIAAVAVLLAAVAAVRPGTIARVAGPVALAAMTLAVFRLGSDGTASGWTLANALGRAEGHCAGWVTGRPLLIGASFGGIDFLVVMTALTFAWLQAAPPPKLRRGLWAALFIALAQAAYLVILALSDDLSGMLPPLVGPVTTEISHLGIWTWGNALHAMLPWRLPVLAAVFHSAIAVAMIRLTVWPEPPALRLTAKTPWRFFGPAGLLVVAVAAIGLVPIKPDLSGRRIVAYDDGTIDWSTSDPSGVGPAVQPRFGLLPALVKSLGGEFVISKDLADADLKGAGVLIVLPPGGAAAAAAAMPDAVREKIWAFVKSGGGLIVAGVPENHLGVEENAQNDLLQPTAMRLRDDTANSLSQRWEDNLLSAPHAATAGSEPGLGHFSFDRAASIRVAWPAGPLVAGRCCWDEVGNDPTRGRPLAYSSGNRLGDLVLAAQQNIGQGTVVVLGDASCLSNDGIPFSYTFTGPLLCSLAEKTAMPLVWWRQLLALTAAGAAIVLLFRKPEPANVAAASLAFAAATIACAVISNTTAELVPAGAKTSAHPIVYIDGSHLDGFGRDPWGEDGLGRFMRVLADNHYLPLVAPDLSAERLSRAAMLISIAPGKAYSERESGAVEDFVKQGGIFLSMTGSPEAGPSRPLLKEFGLDIPPIPVPPWIVVRETAPLGAFAYPSNDPLAEFYGAWPVSKPMEGLAWPKWDDPAKLPVLATKGVGSGQACLLGDPSFALNKNLEPLPSGPSPNPRFWRDSLKNWFAGAPPPPESNGSPEPHPIDTRPLDLPQPDAGKGPIP